MLLRVRDKGLVLLLGLVGDRLHRGLLLIGRVVWISGLEGVGLSSRHLGIS
jgi:hypothetical protein